jgi:hypothetical protein
MKVSLELAFLRAFKDAIMSFNRLDRNLAYFIRYLEERDGRNRDLLKILSHSFDTKLKRVRTLIERSDLSQRYQGFLEMAEGGRQLRNRLVHGDWRLMEHLRKAVLYSVPAPLAEIGQLTIEEFQEQVVFLDRANSLFLLLQRKYPLPPNRPPLILYEAITDYPNITASTRFLKKPHPSDGEANTSGDRDP